MEPARMRILRFKRDVIEMAISEAKKANDMKWRKKAYDRLVFMVRKNAKISADVIRRYAESKNVSVNELIRDTLEKIIRDDKDFMI